MAKLREALGQTPLGDVRTYIQSGNVLARSVLPAKEVEEIVHNTIGEHFGGDLMVVAKTPAQLRNMLRRNPFAGGDTSRMYFSVLKGKPARADLDAFNAIDFLPDQVRHVGDTIYTLYATKHSDSKFNNNFFERKLRVSVTTRNWNTVNALIARS